MVRREFTFPSADGKTPIHAVEWVPDGPVRAVVQISHGVAEHILRYEALASWLTERGIAAAGHDHLGHGSSLAPGAPRLYFGPDGSWDWLAEDIETRRRLLAERFPGVPVFLLGHSMGSFLVRTCLIRYPGRVSGAILTGTGQVPAPQRAFGQVLAALEVRRIGETSPAPRLDRMVFGGYNSRFAPGRTACDWLSLSEENVDAYLADPLCGGIPTAGLFRELLRGLDFIARPAHLKQMDADTPVLFISGDMDPVGGFGKGVRRAYRSFLDAGVRDASIQLYPGLRHEILNEDCRETVFQDLYQWMSRQMAEKEAVL